MRILANENIAASVIAELRRRGHDVMSVKEAMRSAPDEAVLAQVSRDSRLVLTQDKGFGELAVRSGLPAECGVVLHIRMRPLPRVADQS